MSLREWCIEFKEICKNNNCSWLFTGDTADYLDYYSEGESPSEAFSTECSYCGE